MPVVWTSKPDYNVNFRSGQGEIGSVGLEKRSFEPERFTCGFRLLNVRFVIQFRLFRCRHFVLGSLVVCRL